MTQGEILRLIAPKKQVIADASTLTIDCKAAKYSIIELSANRGIDFTNFNTDLEGHILQVKHLASGTSITLPGSNNVSGNWAENTDDITMVACFYNGTSWIFELTPVLAGTTTPTLATPTGFTLTPGNTSMAIAWNAVANATGYVLESSLDGGSWVQIWTGTATSQNYTGLTNGQIYYYRVKATAAGYTDSAWATGSGTPASSSSYDSDAQAFFTAAGNLATLDYTDAEAKTAINDLVLALKAASIWNKMHAVYPFVGGSAAAHKFNLRDPQDTNAAHRLQFFGGITHNANGITGNGTTGYADAFYNPALDGMTDTSAHISAYVRSTTVNNQNGNAVIGAKESTNEVILVADFANLTYSALYNTGDFMNESPTTGRVGTFVVSRTSGSSAKMFRNGNLIEHVTGSSGTVPNSKLLILNQAEQNAIGAAFSDANLAFVSLGDGLNDTEAGQLRTAIENFETALGRNI